MIAVELMSRLGNQMFELATAYHLSKKYNQELGLVESCSSDYVKYPLILDNRKIVTNTTGFFRIEEAKNQAFVDLSDVGKYENVVIKGYFQSDKYFDRQDAEELFKIPYEIKEKYSYLKDKVCISVRRTDYLKYPSLFISPSLDWYLKCYNKYFDGKDVVIASDDINWCKNNFKFNNQEFIENNDATETMFIKACCKNFISPPSTFAWWSAYLSGKDSTVVVPADWVANGLKRKNFNEEDKYVEGWIKMPLN